MKSGMLRRRALARAVGLALVAAIGPVVVAPIAAQERIELRSLGADGVVIHGIDVSAALAFWSAVPGISTATALMM